MLQRRHQPGMAPVLHSSISISLGVSLGNFSCIDYLSKKFQISAALAFWNRNVWSSLRFFRLTSKIRRSEQVLVLSSGMTLPTSGLTSVITWETKEKLGKLDGHLHVVIHALLWVLPPTLLQLPLSLSDISLRSTVVHIFFSMVRGGVWIFLIYGDHILRSPVDKAFG